MILLAVLTCALLVTLSSLVWLNWRVFKYLRETNIAQQDNLVVTYRRGLQDGVDIVMTRLANEVNTQSLMQSKTTMDN